MKEKKREIAKGFFLEIGIGIAVAILVAKLLKLDLDPIINWLKSFFS